MPRHYLHFLTIEWRERRLAVAALAGLSVFGCDSASDNRVLPTRGTSHETITYEFTSPVAEKVAVPTVDLTPTDAPPAKLESLGTLRSDFPISFAGSFVDEGLHSAAITVTFFVTDKRGQEIITNQCVTQATKGDDGRTWTYQVEGRTPKTLKQNNVRVTAFQVRVPEGQPDQATKLVKTLATGTVAIE